MYHRREINSDILCVSSDFFPNVVVDVDMHVSLQPREESIVSSSRAEERTHFNIGFLGNSGIHGEQMPVSLKRNYLQ